MHALDVCGRFRKMTIPLTYGAHPRCSIPVSIPLSRLNGQLKRPKGMAANYPAKGWKAIQNFTNNMAIIKFD